MNDGGLIALIAMVWISNGGDSVGFEYCWQKILDEIRKQEANDGD